MTTNSTCSTQMSVPCSTIKRESSSCSKQEQIANTEILSQTLYIERNHVEYSAKRMVCMYQIKPLKSQRMLKNKRHYRSLLSVIVNAQKRNIEDAGSSQRQWLFQDKDIQRGCWRGYNCQLSLLATYFFFSIQTLHLKASQALQINLMLVTKF